MLKKRLLLTVWAIFAALSIPALAANPITVEQLKQSLLDAQVAHQTDNDTVRRLANVELSAQLRSAELRQLVAMSPGPRTTQALRGLADASLFLDPPESEILKIPAPEMAVQKAMIGKTVHYVARIIPTLPDFLATRITEHFDDTPQPFKAGGWPFRAGLHLDGRFEAPISFMEGGERDTPAPAPAPELKKASSAKHSESEKAPRTGTGLNSWGEFRTLLGIVLVDASRGHVQWMRWERVDGKQAAVFQFKVDRSVSHYSVQFTRNRPPVGKVKTVSNYLYHESTGYHGNIAIDPATGAVLRAVLDADMEPGSPIQRASMLVEYGSVKLGSRSFICPLRSIALSASDEVYQPEPMSPPESLVELQLNEATFTRYQRFGSESTLIFGSHPGTQAADESTSSSSSSPAALPPTQTTPGIQVADATSSSPNASTPNSERNSDASQPAASEANADASVTADEEKADEEILIRAIDSMPGESVDSESLVDEASSGNSGNLRLKSTTRMVDLGLVAYDKHNKPITDLKQEDIEVYDNGRRQQLSAFHQAAPAAAFPSPQVTSQPADTFSNDLATARELRYAPDLLLLLLDESHLAFQDLTIAREELLRFLKATRPTSRIAIYAISEHGFRVILDVTQDHALAMQKLKSWMPSASAVSQAQDLDRRNRQQFDTVHNISDLDSVNGNFADTIDTFTPIDPELKTMGQNPLRETLTGMIALARHFSPVPGHKSMAWIAGDSVLADWEDQAVGLEKGSKLLDDLMQHAKESLNEAHIALYAVDASAVGTGAIDPSLANRNVELDPIAKENASLNGSILPRNNTAGRIQAQMSQDLHGIQGPLIQLAESTGGRAINKGSDIKAVLDSIDRESDSLYELGFEPDTPADGQYHTLLVKVAGRKDVKLRYRSGYLYAEESSTTRQRFQQAIWSPQDAGDLTLTAQAIPPVQPGGESSVRLHINFPSLALQKSEPVNPDKPKPQQDGPRWTDQLYIFVAVRDDATRKAEVSGDTLRLSLKQSTYESGMPDGVPYQRAIDTKSKLGSVRVIVVDGNSGKMGSVTLPTSALRP